MKYLVIGLLLTAALLGNYLFFRENNQKVSAHSTVTIRDKTFIVEVADEDMERSRGLASRESLVETQGMLFVFDRPGLYSFWMKDTYIPLDMIFINNNRIVTIHHNVQPQPNVPDAQLTRYAPQESANYVLEVHGGLSQKYGFQEGDTVAIKQ